MKLKNINYSALGLAILVIAMFTGVGIAIADQNIGAMLIFLILGCAIMGFGIFLKVRQRSDS